MKGRPQVQTITNSQRDLVTKIVTLFEQLPPDAAVTLHEIFELLSLKTGTPVRPTLVRPMPNQASTTSYPTQIASATPLLKLSETLNIAYAGDALADTEALYDPIA